MSGLYLLDSVVVLVYFVVIVGIGLWAGRKNQNLRDFTLGGRSIPWWAVLASILASEISAGTFLGTPGEGFKKLSYTYALLAIGTVIARLIVAVVFIRPFYDMRVVSIYEYLGNRFGVVTKRAASAVFLLTRTLASGSRLFVAAILIVIAYEHIVGLKLDLMDLSDRRTAFWIYFWAVVALTSITTLYTAVGGIKAVVWTDLIQVSLMFGAAGFVFVSLWHQVGGASAIGETLSRPAFWDLGLVKNAGGGVADGVWVHVKNILSSEYTVWAAFLGSVFTTMATHGTDQDMVQRMLTAKDTRRSRWALVGSGLLDVPVVVVFLTIGIMLHLYYTNVKPGGLPVGTDVFPWFMVHDLAPGLRGLLAAGLFATAMGSLSTALNALATSFTRDWYVGLFRPDSSEKQQFRMARWSTVGFAVLLAGVGIGTAAIKLSNPDLRIIPIVLGSFGYTYGSLLGVFLIGMLTKTRGSCRGNMIAMTCGLLATCFLSGAHNDIYDIFHEKEARVRRAQAVLATSASPKRADVQIPGGSASSPDLSKTRSGQESDPPAHEISATLPTVEQIAEKARLTPEEVIVALQHSNATRPLFERPWLPTIAFTWRIMSGTLVTFFVGVCFRRKTPQGL